MELGSHFLDVHCVQMHTIHAILKGTARIIYQYSVLQWHPCPTIVQPPATSMEQVQHLEIPLRGPLPSNIGGRGERGGAVKRVCGRWK